MFLYSLLTPSKETSRRQSKEHPSTELGLALAPLNLVALDASNLWTLLGRSGGLSKQGNNGDN